MKQNRAPIIDEVPTLPLTANQHFPNRKCHFFSLSQDLVVSEKRAHWRMYEICHGQIISNKPLHIKEISRTHAIESTCSICSWPIFPTKIAIFLDRLSSLFHQTRPVPVKTIPGILTTNRRPPSSDSYSPQRIIRTGLPKSLFHLLRIVNIFYRIRHVKRQ